jgi:hypothetical protein
MQNGGSVLGIAETQTASSELPKTPLLHLSFLPGNHSLEKEGRLARNVRNQVAAKLIA